MKYVIVFLLASLAATESMSQRSRIAWRGWTEKNIVGAGESTFIWFYPGGDLKTPDDSRNPTLAFGIFFHENTLRLETYDKSLVATLEEGFAHATPLDEAVLIGPSSNWQAGERFGTDGSRMPLVASTRYTVWHGKTAYLGVRIAHRDQFYYGWINLAISADGLQAEIKEVAFHMDPNQPIITGDRGRIPVGTAVTQTSSTLCFSITNEGNIGYVGIGSTSEATSCPPTQDESRGIGMRYKDRSLMFESGLLLGLDESRVLSTVRGDGILRQDQDLSQSPGSTMRVLKDGDAQRGRVELVDTQARNPIGLHIIQDSFSFSTAEDGDYVILRYEIANRSLADIENMFAGFWVDWDLGADVGQNSIDFDEDRKMGFARSDGEDYPVAGIRVISQDFSVVDSYAGDRNHDLSSDSFSNRLTREGKWEVLSGSLKRRYIFGLDVIHIATVGPIRIPAGQTTTVVFALVAGDDVADLRINADRALAKYQGGIPISTERTAAIPDWITIGEVFPNPITDQATFPYKLSHNNAHVEAEVYDLLGRKVLHLLSARKQAGEHTLTWNTHQMSLPSGMYAVRWTVSYAARQPPRDSIRRGLLNKKKQINAGSI